LLLDALLTLALGVPWLVLLLGAILFDDIAVFVALAAGAADVSRDDIVITIQV